MVSKKTWDEFRESGLLWWINTMLHMFGWAIVVDVEDGIVVGTYPARVKFRGFGEIETDQGYQKVSRYLAENADQLYSETLE